MRVGTIEREPTDGTEELCEECHKPLRVGDRVVFTMPPERTPSRVWHTDCFNGSLTPLAQWPRRVDAMEAGMQIENCTNCGGTHFGAHECPFVKAPCVVCGDDTLFACSDCKVETSKSVHVCGKADCRREHERLNPQHPICELATAT